MQREWTWDTEQFSEDQIRQAFKNHAQHRYNDNMCRANARGKKPGHVNAVLWRDWQEKYFHTPEFIARSARQRTNRMSEKAGPGTGPSTHTAGSRSISDWTRDFVSINVNFRYQFVY